MLLNDNVMNEFFLTSARVYPEEAMMFGLPNRLLSES